MRAWMLAVVATLGGCSASELVQDLAVGPEAESAPPDHRRVVGDNIKAIFPKPDSLGELEISGLRQVDHLRGRAWVTCLRLDARGSPQHYAIFIKAGKILDWRAGIVIDQCHKESYSSFAISTASTQSAPPRQQQGSRE